jgi:hypothetical protein
MSLAACSPEPGTPVEPPADVIHDGALILPARFEAGLNYLTPVTVDGHTLVFCIDTGGGQNMLLEHIAESLGLGTETMRIGDQSVPVVSMPEFRSEAAIPSPAAPVPAAGKLRVVPYEGGMRRLFPPDDSGLPREAGFLGSGWFADRVWTFDNPGARLLLHEQDMPAVADGASQVPLGFQVDADGERSRR